MIPYDDLVAALTAWRERKGMPVSANMPARRVTPPPMAAVAPPPSAAPRTAPPMAPPRAASAVPPPLAPADAADLDDEALLEAHYENEGDDFAMSFTQHDPHAAGAHADEHAHHDDSSTQIGQPPQRDSITTDPSGFPPTGRRDEW
jgi:hypothetical protein